MSSSAGGFQRAIDKWQEGDLDGATALLREIVVSADDTVVPEASHTLGRLLQERGDLDGARAAHRSVIATGHPVFAQRSAIALGMTLTDEEQWALAYRPLRIASSGADAEIAVMADILLVRVLRMLGDLTGSAETLERVRGGDGPDVAELTEGLEAAQWPEDGGERERQAWAAYEAIAALLDEGETDHEVIVTGLNAMLSHGIPELCSRASFRLYTIYADRGEFEECRRVMEHAIAVGDPAERGMAEKLLGAALFDLGEYGEARDAYRRAAEDHRPEVRLDALIQESKFTRELGDEEGSRAVLWRVVESGHPRFAVEARACLGQVYAEAGEVEQAIACWRVVLATDSDFHLGAVHFLGTLLHGLPDDDPRREEILALLGQAADLDDPDVAFQARLIMTQTEAAVRGPDEDLEQAVDDCDTALERLRDGDPHAARALLRRVVDAEIAGPSERASRMLALLEVGAGDPEQADELLEHVADGSAFAEGFAAAVDRQLIASGGDAVHPVLSAIVDYQRLGREAGVARHQECAEHADPAVAALGKSMLAQVYVSFGVPRSQCVELLDEAAAAGDPFALSHASVLAWIVRPDDETDEVIELLRRARAEGHPALAPWVCQALGVALEGRDRPGDLDDALSAYEAVADSGHPGLRSEAEAKLLQILEGRNDLAGAAEVHERITARGDRLQAPRSAWLLGFTRVRLDDFDAARAAFARVPADHPEVAEDGEFARRLLDRDFTGAAAALGAVRERGEDHQVFMTTRLMLESAHAWQRAGDTAAADAALSLAASGGHPDGVQEAALFLGVLRNDAGDRAGAAEALAHAAAGDDERWAGPAASWLAGARRDLGDLDGAAAAYRRALDLMDVDDEERPGLVERLTRVLVSAGRVAEARTLQVEEAGDGPHVDLVIGTALDTHGDLDAAAAHYEAAISDVDGEVAATAGVMLARLLAGKGEAARAAEVARRSISAFERLAEAGVDAEESIATVAYELGGYLTEAGDEEGARTAYERAAASADPGIRIPAKERLGTASPRERALLRLREDDRAGALTLFAEEYGTPVLAELHVALVEGETATARSLVERAAGTEHAERAVGLVVTAVLDRLRGGTDGATELAEPVLEFGGPEQVAIVCDNLGHAYDLAGDIDAAVDMLRRGADVDHPAALACLRRLLGLLVMREEHGAAETAARRAMDSGDPETVTIGVWTLGDLAKARGDLKEAAARYRTAIETAGPDTVPYLRLELGKVLRELGETAAAYRALEEVLSCDDPQLVLFAGGHLGVWLADEGRLAGAAEALGAAVAAGTRISDPDEDFRDHRDGVLNNLASIAHEANQAGDHAVAVRALHLAAVAAPEGARRIAKEQAAEAAERGDLDAARTYYKGAAAFPPDGDPRMLVELAELLAEHDASAEARAILEPLAASEDPRVRLAATMRLVALLNAAGENDRALEIAARAAGQEPPVSTGENTGQETSRPSGATVPNPDRAEEQAGALERADEPEQAGNPQPAGEPEQAGDPRSAGDREQVGGPEQAGHATPPAHTDEGLERLRAGLFALAEDYGGSDGPDGIDSMRWLMSNRSGTPAAGAAGRQVIRAAREMMDTDPAQARAMLELVVEYGDPAEVATAFDDIGDIHRYYEEDVDAALAAYRRGSEVDHSAALVPLRSLILTLSEVEDHDGVVETAQRAVTSGDPETTAVGYWLWGDSRLDRGDADAAIRLYRRGIDIGHEDVTPRIRISLARTLRDRGEGPQARAEMERAADASDPAVRARAGSILGAWAFEDGDLGASAEAFGRVATARVEADGGDAPAELVEAAAGNLFVVANKAAAEGRHGEAMRALTLAAQAGEDREALDVVRRRATECAEADDRVSAAMYVYGAAEFVGLGPRQRIEVADLFVAAGEPAKAREVYERYVDHPDAEVRLVAAGRLVPLLRREDDTDGLENVARRIADDSAATGLDQESRAYLSSILGMIQGEHGDQDGALRTLRAATEDGEPVALYALGDALVDAGEFTEAREVLARVPETESQIGPRSLFLIGRTYDREDPSRAREFYLRVLRVPGGPDETSSVLAKMYLGGLAKGDRDWPEALRWYQQVIDSGGRTGDVSQAPMAAAHLGELAYWLNDRDSAVRFYELTLATGTENPALVGEAAYRLGEIRHRDGDRGPAVLSLQRAIESGHADFAEKARALLSELGEEV
ncbi:tetratricopeptide repeat protein [Actinoallomurus sp. NPDC050550]|uniref:tetratricopeptide repeat protein n=1 Tax=Actinoallomurus sp. NPDC050550 TaxID=3154937 RepID=UPI0033E542E9